MPFGLGTWVGQRNHSLNGGPDASWEGAILREKGAAHCNVVVSCAKPAQPIVMPFGIWTRVGPRKHVLGAVHTGATWRIPPNRPCAAAMRPVVNLLRPLVVLSQRWRLLWSPYVIGQTIIFSSCFFFLSSFFSSPNLSGRRLDVYHTLAHGVALVRI